MSDWRKVMQVCPDGHVVNVGVHGPAGDGLQIVPLGRSCRECGKALEVFEFRFDDSEDAPTDGRSRLYLEAGRIVAAGRVDKLSDGRLNVAIAFADHEPSIEPRSEPGWWTQEQAEKRADQLAEEQLGRKPEVTPWYVEK